MKNAEIQQFVRHVSELIKTSSPAIKTGLEGII